MHARTRTRAPTHRRKKKIGLDDDISKEAGNLVLGLMCDPGKDGKDGLNSHVLATQDGESKKPLDGGCGARARACVRARLCVGTGACVLLSITSILPCSWTGLLLINIINTTDSVLTPPPHSPAPIHDVFAIMQ